MSLGPHEVLSPNEAVDSPITICVIEFNPACGNAQVEARPTEGRGLFMGKSAEWWAENLKDVLTPEYIKELTGIDINE